VTVLTRQPTQYVPGGQPSAAIPPREQLGGVDVRRFRGITASLNIWLRLLDQLVLLGKLLAALLWGPRFDAIYILSPPLLFALPVAVAARLRRIPMVLNLHDLYPQVAVDLGVLKNRFLIWTAERLEAFVYSSAARILVAAPASLAILTGCKQVVPGKVDLLWNFVDPGEWGPQTVENAFRARHGLEGRFVVMYAGQLGLAQDLDVMLECARQTVQERDWLYVVVGDGPKATKWKEQAKGLPNVRMLGPVDTKEYFGAVRAADVALVLLSASFRAPAIPGKTQTIMAVGRPVVAAVPEGNDTAELLRQVNCGIAVPAGDATGLRQAIERLASDAPLRERMGQNGAAYARQHFHSFAAVVQTEQAIQQEAGCACQAGSPISSPNGGEEVQDILSEFHRAPSRHRLAAKAAGGSDRA
jgi:colanic acid biosynthesis glycosyl transferase WcaI